MSLFPFNHIEDEHEFVSAITATHSRKLPEAIFNPIEHIDDDHPLLSNPDIDPDLNFYNSINLCSSNYISMDQLNIDDTVHYKNCFSVAHINCRSLMYKLPDIQLFLVQTGAAVLAVTETWLNANTEDAVFIPGFKFIHKSRSDAGGGGVGFFIRNDIKFEQIIGDWTNAHNNTFESIFIKLHQANGRDVMIGTVYRPPGHKLDQFNDDLDQMLNKLSNMKKNIILAGDFNIDLLKTTRHYPTSVFFNILMSHQLLPTILRPTRITALTATLIDNIFTNILSRNQNSSIIMNDISDHLPILFNTDLCPRKELACPTSMRRLINDKTTALFRTLLTNSDWTEVTHHCDTNDPTKAYQAFMNNYVKCYDIAFPVHQGDCNKPYKIKKLWMTTALLKSANKKSRLYSRYLKNPSNENKVKFTKYRNIFKKLRNAAEKKYYADKFSECEYNLNKTWKIIKVMLTREDSLRVDSFIIDGIEVTDKGIISNKFNDYFVNIGPTLESGITGTACKFGSFLKNSLPSSMGLIGTSPQEIIAIANELRSSTSCGPDGINPRVGKATMEIIAPLLANIVNCSFVTGIVPDNIKIAKVIPIYKSGDKNKINNYRPISVLAYFSKFFEKIMYNRLMEYFIKENTISSEQFGFRRGRSTYMAILEMQDKISDSLDKNEFAMGVFFDLSKAFDTVNHTILLNKLEHYGIRGMAQQWLSNYLQDRTQYVLYEGYQSAHKTIRCGVPQGSILGPLLFLIYINDLPRTADESNFILFADDSNVFFTDKSIEKLQRKVNKELEVISTWFKANKLSLNLAKTCFILFRGCRKPAPQESLEIRMDKKEIVQTDSTKFLGVYVDKHLGWNEHISHISKKLAKNISVLSRIKHCLTKPVLRQLYYTLFFPYLSYCNICWGSNYSSRLKRLETLHKRAIRVTCLLGWTDSTKLIFKEYNILKLVDITKYQIGLFMYRYHYRLLPALFDEYFLKGDAVHSHDTRASHKYRTPGARTRMRQFSIKYSGPPLWESLPPDLRNILVMAHFKTELRQYLLSIEPVN